MNKSEFLILIQSHNIDINLIVFDDPVRDGYCVKRNHLRWEVSYRERGKEYGIMGFPSESDALCYLIKKICK